jgi:nucleoside-diphosphate-sugar epimerase
MDAVVHAVVQWADPRNRGAGSHGADEVFFGVNLTGSLQLFQAAFDTGAARFIFLSSCAVHEVILDDRPLDEAHPLWPTSPYGAHKAALEKFVHGYGLGQGWPICALRPTGIYGLAYSTQACRWFNLVGQVMRGVPIRAAKGGKEVHAADVDRALALLLNADAKTIASEAFNCYDLNVAEEQVARIAKELTRSRSTIAPLNRGPKHQIATQKIRAVGMTFGGQERLAEEGKVTMRRFMELTAYHEAGHAVVAFALRRAVVGVSIVPDGDSNGRLVNRKLPDTFSHDVNNDGRTRWFVEREIMVFLAGGLALEKLQGHRRALHDGEDRRRAINPAGYVCSDEEEIGAYLAWLGARTKLLLNQPWNWRAVADLARALLEHRELSGRVARRIYQAAIDTYGQDDAERAAMDAAVGWGT